MSTLPTPRTDALLCKIAGINRSVGDQLTRDLCRQLERELTEAKAERDALKAALAIGQENCDAEYNRLRDERDEMTKVAQGACKAEGEALKREDRWRALAEELAGALEKINKDIPACDQNGQLYVLHFDGEGNELGQEFVDPVALCGHLSARIEEALTRFRDAANPASGAAITPVIHRTE